MSMHDNDSDTPHTSAERRNDGTGMENWDITTDFLTDNASQAATAELTVIDERDRPGDDPAWSASIKLLDASGEKIDDVEGTPQAAYNFITQSLEDGILHTLAGRHLYRLMDGIIANKITHGADGTELEAPRKAPLESPRNQVIGILTKEYDGLMDSLVRQHGA